MSRPIFSIGGRPSVEPRHCQTPGHPRYAKAIRQHFLRCPAGEQAVWIPVADSKRGESVKACVVLSPVYDGNISEQELIESAKGEMAAYKCPRAVEFRSAVPENSTGKILRRVLREEEVAKHPASDLEP